jgi:hypothetical protein
MKTPILGSAYVARSVNAADNRMVNLYPEAVADGGKEAGFLNRAPGLRLLATIGDGPIRGLWWHGNYGYAVSGSKFYKFDTDYNATLIGNVGNYTTPVSMTDNGYVIFIADNGLGFQYEISTNTLLQITDVDFAGASVVGYLNTYFIYIEPNSQRFYYLETFDVSGSYIFPLVFDATQVFSAEGSPDNLVSMIVDHGELWLLGENSVEVWYQSGSDQVFDRIQGAFNELGCAARFSVSKMDNGLFWLGADARGRGMVFRANGYRGERISTHAIEFALSQYSTISDAVSYTYQQEGHNFYVLTFPSADATWVYDAATQAWHERAGWIDQQFTRHRSNCQLAFNNEVIVGDYENGSIYAFDLEVYDDNGDIQRWLRSWRALPTGQNDLTRTAHHSLQLDMESGVGVTDEYFEGELATETGLVTTSGSYALGLYNLWQQWLYSATDPALSGVVVGQYISGDYIVPGTQIVDIVFENFEPGYPWYMTLTIPTTNATQLEETVYFYDSLESSIITTESGDPLEIDSFHTPGADPQVMLRWSDDGGHTWSNEHWASMGKVGEYFRRVLFRRLGMTLKIRDRVYEISGTDPIKTIILGAELRVNGTNA